MVARHIEIAVLLGRQESLVALLKFLLLHRLIGKGLHDPDAGEVVLNLAVNFRNLHPVALKGSFHPGIEIQRIQQHQRHKGKGHQRQLHINAKKDEEGTEDFNDRNHQILRAMMQKLTDIKQIAGYPGHQLPHLLVVEKGKGQLLVMAKNLRPHIVFDFCAHHMAIIRNKVIAEPLHCHQRQHQQAKHCNFVEGGACL